MKNRGTSAIIIGYLCYRLKRRFPCACRKFFFPKTVWCVVCATFYIPWDSKISTSRKRDTSCHYGMLFVKREIRDRTHLYLFPLHNFLQRHLAGIKRSTFTDNMRNHTENTVFTVRVCAHAREFLMTEKVPNSSSVGSHRKFWMFPFFSVRILYISKPFSDIFCNKPYQFMNCRKVYTLINIR